jgi:4,5-dihydroxyphthalate decarboxylase
MNNELALTLAISPYDLVSDLTAGLVVAEGIKLTSLVNMPVEEIFYRFIVNREWDVSEISLAKYVSMRSQGDASFIAIPVFPSRIFRHASVFVRRDGPVKAPPDLAGRHVGLPEWAQTASVYSRGFLMHQFDVDLASIKWVQAGVNRPGRIEKVEVRLPPGVEITRMPEATLSEMLVSGEVDAVLSARAPACFDEGHPNIRRLFENFMEVEAAYYQATSIFPIMHTVAIRGELLERHPWIAVNLLRRSGRQGTEASLVLSIPRIRSFQFRGASNMRGGRRKASARIIGPTGSRPIEKHWELFCNTPMNRVYATVCFRWKNSSPNRCSPVSVFEGPVAGPAAKPIPALLMACSDAFWSRKALTGLHPVPKAPN